MLSRKDLVRKYDRSKFVKSPWYDQVHHDCLICMQPAHYPQTCLKCHLIVCKRCALKWQKEKKGCPKKCSQGEWKLKDLEPFKIEYTCPYDRRCGVPISTEDFQEHLSCCEFIPEEFKNIKSLEQVKRQYLCECGQKLSYLGSAKSDLIHNKCIGCDKKTVCRSMCNSCLMTFCSKCRPPLGLTRKHCPQGHKLLYQVKQLAYITCDYCVRKVLQAGQFCYNDPVCDYAVCAKCYEILPEGKEQ